MFPARPYVVAFARWSQCKKLTIAQPNQPLILNVSLGSGNNIVHRRSQGDKPSVGKLSPELSAFRATRAKWRRLRGSSFLDAGQSLRIHLIFGRSAHRRPQPKFLMLAHWGSRGMGFLCESGIFQPGPSAITHPPRIARKCFLSSFFVSVLALFQLDRARHYARFSRAAGENPGRWSRCGSA